MTLKEYIGVTVNKAIPRLSLPVGARGVVVHVYGNGEAFEVELFDANGGTLGVETFEPADLTPEQT